MSAPGVAIAVLAAGNAARFGRAKLLAPLAGRPLILHALDAARASGSSPVLAVVGASDSALWRVVPGDVALVLNSRAPEGIASSLGAALAYLGPLKHIGAVCIGLGDQPLVGAEAYRRLAAAHAEGASLAVATYGGERRNPVLLAREVWPRATQLRGDEGARRLMGALPVVEVTCDGTGDPFDVDTVADLAEVERRYGMG